MKRWITVLLMVVFAAGISVAEEKAPWWKFGFGGDKEEQVSPEQATQRPRGDRQRPQGEHPERKRDQRRQKISEKQRAEMKAHYEAVHQLAEAARTETDPAKKAELTEKLRVILTEGAQKMQARFRKRVEKAEQDLAKMKERLEKGEVEMEQRVDEHLQKLLSGEKPERKGRPQHGRRPDGPPPEGPPPAE